MVIVVDYCYWVTPSRYLFLSSSSFCCIIDSTISVNRSDNLNAVSRIVFCCPGSCGNSFHLGLQTKSMKSPSRGFLFRAHARSVLLFSQKGHSNTVCSTSFIAAEQCMYNEWSALALDHRYFWKHRGWTEPGPCESSLP